MQELRNTARAISSSCHTPGSSANHRPTFSHETIDCKYSLQFLEAGILWESGDEGQKEEHSSVAAQKKGFVMATNALEYVCAFIGDRSSQLSFMNNFVLSGQENATVKVGR